MKKNLRILLMLFLALGIGGLKSELLAKHYQVRVKDNGISQKSRNISPALYNLLSSWKAKLQKGDQLSLLFEPGTYYFAAEGAPKRELYISNHDQIGERSVGILLEEMNGVSLIGEQTEFVFLDRMLPIALIGSKDVKINGLSIDFDEPQITQIEIVKNLGKFGGIGFIPAPWVNWRINTKKRFESYGSNWSHVPNSGIVFNKNDYRTAYRISDLDYDTEGLTMRGDTLFAPKWHDDRLKEGMVVSMRTYYRPQPALFIDACQEVKVQNVDVYYAEGMGLLAQNTHNISLEGFNVCRRGHGYIKADKISPRYFTTQADATHFSGCSGHISVQKGVFEHMMDDAINVHGVYLKLSKRLNDYTVEASYMHEQAWGFEWGRVGDPVQFIYSQTFDSVEGYNEIAEITPTDKPSNKGAKTFRIRFKNKLPKDLIPKNSIGLENMRKLASVDFSHNTIRNNRARGALFNSPKEIKVHHNHFDHISGAAIVASTDCNMWFESGQTQKLHISQNTFTDVLTSLYQFTEAIITLHPIIPKIEKQKTPFYGAGKKGILIENNIFRTFDTPLLYAKSVKGLLWRNNLIEITNTYPKYHWNQEKYKLIGSKDITIEE